MSTGLVWNKECLQEFGRETLREEAPLVTYV